MEAAVYDALSGSQNPGSSGAQRDDEPISYLSEKGELREGRSAPFSLEETRRLYEAMLRIRLVDERMIMTQRQGRIGFYIGGIGEEACIIGPVAALRDSDWFFPCYRENGAYLLRGMPFDRWVDNLFGNASDPVQGRQMPNHIAWREKNIVSVSSPIGTQIPQAVGMAYAARMSGQDDVAMVYFGEGATSSNDFHTGLNFAGVWKAPVVFICRNNRWAISVPSHKQCAADHVADKAPGYGMPGVRVDGNDLFACWAVADRALERARRGGGPTLIECMTYRVQGHSTSDDPKAYRKEEEVEPWRGKDPLDRVRLYLEAQGAWSQEEETDLRASIDAQIREVVRRAEKVPAPALSTLFDDVFQERPWFLEEQAEEAVEARKEGGEAEQGAFPL